MHTRTNRACFAAVGFVVALVTEASATICWAAPDAAASRSDVSQCGTAASTSVRTVTSSSCAEPRGKAASLLLQARSSVTADAGVAQQVIPPVLSEAANADKQAFGTSLLSTSTDPEVLSLDEWFTKESKAVAAAVDKLGKEVESVRKSIMMPGSSTTTEPRARAAPPSAGSDPRITSAGRSHPRSLDGLAGFSWQAFVPAWLHGGGAGTKRNVFVGLMLFGCMFGLMLACAWPRSRESLHEMAPFNREVRKEIDEDIYGMLITTLVLDTTTIARERAANRKVQWARWARVIVSCVFMAITTMFQAFMLYQIAGITNSQAVKGMQQAYNEYEIHMYSGHTVQFAPGVTRGIPGHYNASLFLSLSDDLKTEICRMPLSRIDLLMGILIIWTFAAIIEFKAALACLRDFIIGMPTLQSMEVALRRDVSKIQHRIPKDEGEMLQTIVGLTAKIKSMILVFIVIPRMSMVTVLLWLGCRWLTATNDFGDLILDAVALEFVLLLKNLLYSALAPRQSELDIRCTAVATLRGSGRPSAREYVGSFAWGIAVLCWVILYLTFLQSVLPSYRWDISMVCRWHV